MATNNKRISSLTRSIRKKFERRKRDLLNNVINSDKTSGKAKQWARNTIQQMELLSEASKLAWNEGGKRHTRSRKEVGAAIRESLSVLDLVQPKFTYEGNANEITRVELNKGKIKSAVSIYTAEEVAVFYKSTQRIWQQEGISNDKKNEAIMAYVNGPRVANGQAPMSLEEIVSYVLQNNKRALNMLKLNPRALDGYEDEELYAKAQQSDNEDHHETSPIFSGQKVINYIRDQIERLYTMPDPLKYGEDEEE